MAHARNASAAAARARFGSATRTRILEAAQELFAARGFDRTSIRAIARQVGLTDAALYYHFASKRDLLEALLAESSSSPRIAPLHEPPPMDRDEIAELVLENFFAWLTEHQFVRVVLSQQLLNDPSSVEFRRQAIASFFDLFGPVLRDTCGADATVILHSLNFLLYGALWDAMLAGDLFTNPPAYAAFEDRIRGLVELILRERATRPAATDE
jgi:AcrR family transcriptional regulator